MAPYPPNYPLDWVLQVDELDMGKTNFLNYNLLFRKFTSKRHHCYLCYIAKRNSFIRRWWDKFGTNAWLRHVFPISTTNGKSKYFLRYKYRKNSNWNTSASIFRSSFRSSRPIREFAFIFRSIFFDIKKIFLYSQMQNKIKFQSNYCFLFDLHYHYWETTCIFPTDSL